MHFSKYAFNQNFREEKYEIVKKMAKNVRRYFRW